MRVMVRRAHDDFYALLIANAIESVGATVFSITSNQQETYPGALLPHTTFHVWAKVPNDLAIDAVDEAIEGAIDDGKATR